jgi:hypothetical protein
MFIEGESVLVSQTIFAAAAKSGSAADLIAHLGTLPQTQKVVGSVAELVRHSGALIFQRPDALAQARRDVFVADIRAHLERSIAGADLTGLDAAERLIRIAEDVRQVQRLRDALTKWPEILTDEFGSGVAGKKVVHCLVENDTYCIPGGVDGVYVYDWSALK